jgi:uncharacterized protein
MTIVLPATLLTAAACALINLWLGWRVGQVRMSEKVPIGDGGNMRVIARMRAHANFVEYAPFALILLAALELAKGAQPWIWGYGAVLVVARIAHGLGMDTWKPGRMIGISLTLLLLAAMAIEAGVTAFSGAPTEEAVPIEVVPAA